MVDKGFSNFSDVENYYCDRVTQIVQGKGAKYIVWQDPIDIGVKVLYSLHIITLAKDQCLVKRSGIMWSLSTNLSIYIHIIYRVIIEHH